MTVLQTSRYDIMDSPEPAAAGFRCWLAQKFTLWQHMLCYVYITSMSRHGRQAIVVAIRAPPLAPPVSRRGLLACQIPIMPHCTARSVDIKLEKLSDKINACARACATWADGRDDVREMSERKWE